MLVLEIVGCAIIFFFFKIAQSKQAQRAKPHRRGEGNCTAGDYSLWPFHICYKKSCDPLLTYKY